MREGVCESVCVREREREREREGHLGVNKGIVERLVLDLALLDALQRLGELLRRRGGDLPCVCVCVY